MVVMPLFTSILILSRFGLILLIASWLLLIGTNAQANSTLEASVDRTKIYQNDTINLTVIGEVQLEFSFGGLLNFGRNSIEPPEIPGLEKDFEIVDQQQKYNMQTINGKSSAQTTWKYTLLPKRTGKLTIPAAKYKDAKDSKPISIEVLPGKAPRDADRPPLVFLEIDVDKKSAYVQEQILYTLRLYAADHLASGDLSAPEPENAIVEQMGETNKYFAMAYNQRYEVRERKYLIFPQKSGVLDINPIQFTGILIDSRSRQRRRVFENSDPVELDIKPPPTSFSGDIWLPAMSLNLTESWDITDNKMSVGDATTRVFDLQALGLLGSALPPLKMAEQKGLKIYPDQPEQNSLEHESGAQSQRTETNAIVAVSPATIELPEISIPWWDTVNDVERKATIPARTIQILPIAANDSVQSDPSSTFANTESNQTNAATTESNDPTQAVQANEIDTAPLDAQILYILIAFLALGWLTTTIILLNRNGATTASNQNDEEHYETTSFTKIERALKDDHPDLPRLIVTWLNAARPDLSISSYQELANISPKVVEQLSLFEQQRYGLGNPTGLDKSILLTKLEELSLNNRKQKKNSHLQPFYP